MLLLTSIAIVVALYVDGSFGAPGNVDDEWHQFMKAHKKSYKAEEQLLRKQIWRNRKNYIDMHNTEADRGRKTFKMKMNAFGDMTLDEFRQSRLGAKPTMPPPTSAGKHRQRREIPANLDWREYGYVTDVKDQGECGSCWAFSAVASLEGQWFKHRGTLNTLSEQNLVDCAESGGCNGGWMTDAWDYIAANGGIATNDSYPYEDVELGCWYGAPSTGANCSRWSYIDIPGDEASMLSAVATIGPISVGIKSSLESFMLYSDGVYYDTDCTGDVDHGAVVVGFGTDANLGDYWIVKNSWGPSWGESGYVRMSRNQDNNCMIASYGLYPIII